MIERFDLRHRRVARSLAARRLAPRIRASPDLLPAMAAVVFGTGLLACSIGSHPALSREVLAERIESGTAPVVIDVRSASEYRSGHVPGAINMPFRSVRSRHEEISLDKDEPIVVYCGHGPRAAWAVHALRRAGYSNVKYLEGHMTAWEDSGLPVEVTPEPDAE